MTLWQRLGRLLRRSDRRRHAREYGPQLRLTVGGVRCETLDWSLGGFRLAPAALEVAPGAKIEGRIKASHVRAEGEFTARVIRVAENGEIGARWLEISADVFARLGNLGAI